MREILFRGKRTDTGEWVEGFYTLYANNRGVHPCILTGTEQGCVIPAFVNPETVGQYTGLTDNNGKRIWENDIVRELGYEPQVAVVKFGNGYYDGGIYPFVGWYYQYPNDENVDGQALYERVAREDFEVIGNSIDNPNLLTERVTTNDE